MRIEILGSGGATPTPRPGCRCAVCEEARAKGVPYARTGPSVFLHGADVLFDTPEECRLQLERAGIGRVAACFYSHWHPDHVMGRRIFETMHVDLGSLAGERDPARVTDVYLPERVAEDFRAWLGSHDHLAYMEHMGWIRRHVLADGESVTVAGVQIRPLRLAVGYVYGFELREGDRRVLLVLDEADGWVPGPELRGCDLAILPRGLSEHDPFTGERRIPAGHPILDVEATFEETLAIVDGLEARRVVLTHVEEVDGLSHDDLLRLAPLVGRSIEFAFDGMVLEA